ncbi:MAG TPA: hypothetical protein DFI01_07515 [Bacteroidales bacterium]|nr:hypothetical protein [Bacteroidales bacterium]
MLFFNFLVFAQDERVKEIIFDKDGQIRMINFVESKFDIPSKSSIDLVKEFFKISDKNEFRTKSIHTDKLGDHIRYAQE